MHKYNAIRTEVDGHSFPSKAEAAQYTRLCLELKAGIIKRFELQPVFKFKCGAKYIADFKIEYPDETIIIEDVKGIETPVFKLKMKLMKYEYPEVKIVLVKNGKREIITGSLSNPDEFVSGKL